MLLRERIGHLESGMTTEKEPAVATIDRTIREQAFTILNRFAALRMCEERGLVEECVRNGFQSKGFQVYERVAGAALGDIYERYKTFLFCLFDEIAFDLGMLFDRFSPQGLLFPREQALLDLFAIININDLGNIWSEDETIGWIYQYFNPSEERRAMRAASQAPRNSRELAVRNQFFTPRYVVEFLTDNTLGRIWYEMRKGKTKLKDSCQYLVRRPNEIFLNSGEASPHEMISAGESSQEELSKKTDYIQHRPKKDPRKILMLDPACGSFHFGLYSFDLFAIIYEEAWDDPDLGPAIHEDFLDREDYLLQIPKLIIENNLHGIDIDPRAVQIAALALWLRAQNYWKSIGLKVSERPQIARSNIVTAEPMPGEEDIRREFIEGLKPRVLGQLVEVAFDKMNLAGEAGSLLKIEEEIQDGIREAKEQWISESKRAKDKKGNELLFSEAEMDRIGGKVVTQQKLFDVSDITDEDFWNQAEDRILGALKDYSEQIDNGRAVRRRLFAEDAARGFAFIDLCRKRYDVVLMNPPFGESSETIAPYLGRKYQYWTKNLLCASISRSIDILENCGFLGAIFDRTAAIKSSYAEFRREILDKRILTVADTGWNVLDANVETTVHVLKKKDQEYLSTFFDVRDKLPDKKADQLLSMIQKLSEAKVGTDTYLVKPVTFLRLPNAIVGYYFEELLLRLFHQFDNIAESGYQARKGHDFVSDIHFRLFWEIIPEYQNIGDRLYFNLYNGGKFSMFSIPIRDVTLYGSEGLYVRSHPSTLLRNQAYQLKSGIGYGKRGDILDAHALPAETFFTSEGLAITDLEENEALLGLSYLNSSLAQFIINQYCGQHKQVGYVNLIPFPDLSSSDKSHVIDNCKSILEIRHKWYSVDETTLEFSGTLFTNIIADPHESLANMIASIVEPYESDIVYLKESIERNDTIVGRAAQLSKRQTDRIKEYISRRPEQSPWPDMEADRGEEQLVSFLVRELVSHSVGIACGRWDVRIALDPSLVPKLPDPFDPIPVCPPGMLIQADGLPSEPSRIVSEEWLRARSDANSLPPEGAVKNQTIPDSEYPLRISWEGILVDDSVFNCGQLHRDNIVARVREVLDLIWKDQAHEIEQEACEILSVCDLHNYFRKSSGFFQDHLKRYSKSRRKAPIYWPISTSSGSYTLWIYYHRLTDQTLYACANDYVNPKLDDIAKDVERLQEQVAKQSTEQSRQKLEQLVDFERELKDFRDELLRIAALPYKPNLNDGVIITASPLWKLFRHNQWIKDLKACWKKLEAGEYDWAHLAYEIWPDRVKEKCKKDLSIAIAHGMENLYEGEISKPKKRRKKAQA